MSLTASDITGNADLFRAALPSWPHPEPETAPCRICAKRPDQPHDSATRSAHISHLTRYGWSGMCPAPHAAALRAAMLAAGDSAESPDKLDPEGELLARLERQS